MKRSILSAAVLGFTAGIVPAQTILNFSWSDFDSAPSLSIPDANATGVSDIRTITGDGMRIANVAVTFEAAGDFNGDLYLTLQHGSGFSVLLNRPGRAAGDPFGYADAGFDVTFADGAPNGDIHTYQDAVTPEDDTPLAGTWQPDARPVDPGISVASSPRSAYLSAFQGQNLAGDWTLFAADLSGGAQTEILSWGLQITVVPEPRQTALYAAMALFALAALKRTRRSVLKRRWKILRNKR